MAQQSRGVELTQVYAPDMGTEANVDIIAIHGLDTKSPDTWTWQSKHPNEPDVNWLSDPDMLPRKVGPARIFTCDWPADLRQQSDLIPMRLEQFALLLLEGIKSRPLATNGREREDRPILFVASCLGGIILMEALLIADHDSEYASLRRATRGIVFLATPFRGTAFKDISNLAVPVLKAWSFLRYQEVTTLLNIVKGSTFTLENRVHDFTKLCQDIENSSGEVFTFYETGKTILLQKILPAWLFSPLLLALLFLVDKNSATLQIVPNPLPLKRPHVTMNKFNGPEDPDYELVAQKIEEILGKIREGSILNKADAWIRGNRYAADRLKIERLSGQVLSMDQCYINLAIVEQPGQDAGRSKEGDVTPSPFSLFARQKVETPDKTIQVELPTIFSQRKRRDGRTIQPRRILIRGRAGVGKTTLCKKIVHDFTRGTQTELYDSWRKLFDRLLWVPLRRLKELPDVRYNLEELFCNEYFSQKPDGRLLANEMWRALDTKADGTLFILDGLDEVSEGLVTSHKMFPLLKVLLSLPNVIITSRPSAKLPDDLPAPDLELETIGFYPDQVKEYLKKAIPDPQRVEKVQSFLQHHWLIQGLVRIPIQLDALCYTWDEGFSDNDPIPETMTAVYKAIVQSLWKKDVVRLDKKSESYVRKALQSEIKRDVEVEATLLECLAFTGLYNDVIEFQPAHQDAISEWFKPREAGFSLNGMLENLSFLRTSDPSSKPSNRSYHFLHLTFQEYFAARYFVRQWKARKPLECLVLKSRKNDNTNPVSFLQKHKYSAHYDVFWRFVAGLLDADNLDADNHALTFFEMIEKEPLDLLGPTHQRLVMHCLSEVDTSTNLPIRSNLEAKLSQWLLFECDLTGSSLLARESECPDQALSTALETDSRRGRVGILEALQQPGRHFQSTLSEATIAALTALLKDGDNDVRSAAAEALWRQSNLSEATVAALTALLKDGHRRVRSAAAQALGSQSNLPEATVAALVALLKDGHRRVRSVAAEVLEGQLNLSEATVAALVALLKDEDNDIRAAAAQALGSQSNLSEATVAALMALLKDEDNDMRYTAAQALGSQSNLSEATVAALTAMLKDGDDDMRAAAAEVLEGQSNLPEATIAALTALLKDRDNDIRAAAAQALEGQLNLPEATVAALVAPLKDGHRRVRSVVARALRGQLNLSEATIAALTALLKDRDNDIRAAAAQALRGQSNLPEATIAALTVLLKDRDEDMRAAAARALRGQSNLPEATGAALVALLKDGHRRVRSAAAQALEGQSTLPEATVAALMALLKDGDNDIRYTAAEALGSQSNLSEATVAALVALLKDEDNDVRAAAAEALQDQSNLSDRILDAIGLLLESERLSTLPLASSTSQEGSEELLWHTTVNKEASTTSS
ncbi:armadillo-type protein [Fusarium oxysporum]|nr:armadillo-type protein [Fusarium oxysporum]